MAEIDSRFKYETYERNVFATREELTDLSKVILGADSWWKLLLAFLKAAAVYYLFKVRESMFEEEMRLGKQIYERRRTQDNTDDLEDDLDG